jgi:hypothetical protein
MPINSKANKNYAFVCIIILITIFLIYYASISIPYSANANIQLLIEPNTYRSECFKLLHKLRYPDKRLLHDPPLKEPPPELFDEFTQHGEMPILRYWYFNDLSYSVDRSTVKKSAIDSYVAKIRQNQPLGYNDLSLKDLMFTFGVSIAQKTFVVIGTIEPWIESLAFELQASKITTLDYNYKKVHIQILVI